MCGIIGRVSSLNETMPQDLFDTSLLTMRKRGPDDSGVLIQPKVQMAMTRLSILDKPGGHQPMFLPDGSSIVFNGQIYNHLELRGLVSNYDWKTRSDTETLLVLLNQLGKSVVPKLCGMFSFAYWNQKTEELILGRDFFGEKPLFYLLDKDVLLFSSTCDALVKLVKQEIPLNYHAIAQFIVLGFIISENTLYENVKELSKGSILSYKAGEISHFSYQLEFLAKDKPIFDPVATGIGYLNSVLEEELCADVPIGLFLSGGIDSSLIASLAGNKSEIVSFTASMSSNQYDVNRAVGFSKHLKLSHNIVEINSSDVERAFDDLALAFDQPFGDSAAIPMLLMSEYAKKHVGVCLSGDGADELFGGYGWRYSPLSYLHSPSRSSRFFQSVPVLIMRYFSSSRKVNLLSKHAPFFQIMSDVRKYARHSESCLSETYFSENYLYGMFEKMTKEERELFNFLIGEGFDKSFTFVNAMTFDQRFYLPNDILVKTDRASMFHSLEVRSPYLHPNMFNYSLNLRDELKVDGLKTKEILYQMLIQSSGTKLGRPSKMGLGGPLKDWINLNKIQDSIRKSTTNEMIQEAMQFVPKIIREQIGSKHKQLNWNLAVLQEWISRRF